MCAFNNANRSLEMKVEAGAEVELEVGVGFREPDVLFLAPRHVATGSEWLQRGTSLDDYRWHQKTCASKAMSSR